MFDEKKFFFLAVFAYSRSLHKNILSFSLATHLPTEAFDVFVLLTATFFKQIAARSVVLNRPTNIYARK